MGGTLKYKRHRAFMSEAPRSHGEAALVAVDGVEKPGGSSDPQSHSRY